MERLFEQSVRRVKNTPTVFTRFLFERINWHRRLIGIRGPRGVGKTTLLLQYIKLKLNASDSALYVSLDDLYFANHTIAELADYFVKLGGKFLFLDEIHKYPSWSRELKNIYDNYPDLQIVFTGSSALDIDKGDADLSRRAVMYDLPVMSLREYLAINNIGVFSTFSLSEIIENHREISLEITDKIKPLKYLYEYFRTGAYPFFNEVGNAEEYYQHLQRIVNLILETDLPAFTQIDYLSVYKLKKLLSVIAESVPFHPNISKLSERIGVMRDTLVRYLYYLERAGLIALVHRHRKGISKLSKPEKIYLNDTNLVYALQGNSANIGTVRETFFRSQLSVNYDVKIPDKGDFIVDDKFIFEIGGKNKTQKQIAGLKDAYVAIDGIEYGVDNKIPLWLFGFLY